MVIVLVIGSGGREHAIVRALAQDPQVSTLHAAPGSPGIMAEATCHSVDLASPQSIADLAETLGVDLVVIGPENPLVEGAADAVRDRGIACFGPSAQAAQLEGSKTFAKNVMTAAGVPTAAASTCTTMDDVQAALAVVQPPYVVKDDGLAAGKGVVVTDNLDAALDHAQACLDKDHGAVVIEEYLSGPEVSLFCLSDGTTVVPLVPAQDFKRIFDNDEGPNTGGMGAYSPLPWAPEGLVDEVMSKIAQPVIDHMREQGAPFVGVLYCGLALTSDGVKVIEFNARFGDPETQVVLDRLTTALGGLLMACATGQLAAHPPLTWRDESSVIVVMASPGYPGTVHAGQQLTGLDDVRTGDCYVLHAGTALRDGALVASGGRVLSVVARGGDLDAARRVAYKAVEGIGFEGAQYRTDIALSAVKGAVSVP